MRIDDNRAVMDPFRPRGHLNVGSRLREHENRSSGNRNSDDPANQANSKHGCWYTKGTKQTAKGTEEARLISLCLPGILFVPFVVRSPFLVLVRSGHLQFVVD